MKLNGFFLEKADFLDSSSDWSFKPRIFSKYLLRVAFIHRRRKRGGRGGGGGAGPPNNLRGGQTYPLAPQ